MKNLGTIIAADEEGNNYSIDCYQHQIISDSLDGREVKPGRKQFMWKGTGVNLEADGSYHIIAIDKKVKPKATR